MKNSQKSRKVLLTSNSIIRIQPKRFLDKRWFNTAKDSPIRPN